MLPQLFTALATGQVSYAQTRAIVRVATPQDESTWIELARTATAAQLEKVVRGVSSARGDRPEPDKPAAKIAYDEDGTLVLTLRIRAADAPGVLAALESAQAADQAERHARLASLGTELASRLPLADSAESPDPTTDAAAPPCAEPYEYVAPPYLALTPRVGMFDPRPPGEDEALAEYWAENQRRRDKQFAARAWADYVEREAAKQQFPPGRATLADGLVRLVTKPENLPPVTVKVLLDPLSGWGRTPSGELLPPMTLKQVLRTLPGRGSQKLQAGALTRHDLGRRSRAVSPALRELLGHLDGERCRFPSCTRTRNLHAHHVRFWRDGGCTDLSNLVLVCSRHHTLIHTEGYQLVLSPDRTLTVRTKADIPVPHHPTRLQGSPSTQDIAPFTSGWQGDRLDLSYVVMVMTQQTC